MKEQFDRIAGQYKQHTESLVRRYVETHTIFEMAGDLQGKSVLDLACGEGYFTRKIKLKGAARVVGVDISEKMIDLARQSESVQPLGVEYVHQDVKELGRLGEFDLVVAVYLLNYARTKEELLKMCHTASDNLKPDGRFLLLNDNILQESQNYQGYARYGLSKTITEPRQEGSPITYTIFRRDQNFQFDVYYLSKETYEWAFRTAGFQSIRWQKISVSPEGVNELGHKYWEELLNNPPFIAIECRK